MPLRETCLLIGLLFFIVLAVYLTHSSAKPDPKWEFLLELLRNIHENDEQSDCGIPPTL